jgi:hypothetical protein
MHGHFSLAESCCLQTPYIQSNMIKAYMIVQKLHRTSDHDYDLGEHSGGNRNAEDGLHIPVFCQVRISQQHLNLPIPTISLCTTNCVSVPHVFLYVCACSTVFCSNFCSQSLFNLCPCSPMLFVLVYTFSCHGHGSRSRYIYLATHPEPSLSCVLFAPTTVPSEGPR